MSVLEIFQIFGGLGLFLLGMDMMSEGLKRVAGERLKDFLNKITSNVFKSVFLGTVVTMIIQSSNATAVMVIGFVNAGLISLTQAAGVILGSNIGTTITAQLIAFKVTDIAPLFIAIGVVMKLFSKKDGVKQLGDAILGFGILFLGINTMSATLSPLASNEFFVDMLVGFSQKPLLGLLMGILITALIQSSSASVGLLQALALGGAFSSMGSETVLALTIPIILGMNVGASVTAVLGSINGGVEGKKTALMHVLFKITGAVWFLLFIAVLNRFSGENNLFFRFIEMISGQVVSGSVFVPDYARQIANSHMVFNILNTIVILPFINVFVRIAEKAFPGSQKETPSLTVRLDERIIETPTVAINEILKEVLSMIVVAKENVLRSYNAVCESDMRAVQKVYDQEKVINQYEKEITRYLIKLSAQNLSMIEAQFVMNMYHTIHDVEKIGDHAKNIADLAKVKINDKIEFSQEAKNESDELFLLVRTMLDALQRGFTNFDSEDVFEMKRLENRIDQMEESLRVSHIDRLNRGKCVPDSGVLFLDMIADMEKIADNIDNISAVITEYKAFL